MQKNFFETLTSQLARDEESIIARIRGTIGLE